MNFGLGGLSEIALIFMLVLLLFGTKEVPHIFREMARLFAKIKMYSDKIKRELDEAVKLDEPKNSYESIARKKKDDLRLRYRAARDELTAQQRTEKSNDAWKHLVETPQYKEARAIMVYANTGSKWKPGRTSSKCLPEGNASFCPIAKTPAMNLAWGNKRP